MSRLLAIVASCWWLTAGPVACSAASPRPAWGFALDGHPITGEALAALGGETGLRPRLIVFFQQWPENPAAQDFPKGSLEAIAAIGAEPVITWEPMFYRAADNAETMIPAAQVTDGAYDGYIMAYARAAAAWGKPMIIRFAHEMNLSRYHWGGTAAEYGPASPERFRAMWRHVVTRFRAAGATNVRWAFSPNCESIPGVGNPAAAPWNTARAYYPGDEFVDLLGMDGYNWGDTQTPEKHGWRSSWKSFAATFSAMHADLRALSPGKPIYVFETASAPTGGNKAAWIADMTATTAAWNLAGVVWFNVNKEVDWRLTAGVTAAALEPVRKGFATGEPAQGSNLGQD